jgi:hypothetical protein
MNRARLYAAPPLRSAAPQLDTKPVTPVRDRAALLQRDWRLVFCEPGRGRRVAVQAEKEAATSAAMWNTVRRAGK